MDDNSTVRRIMKRSVIANDGHYHDVIQSIALISPYPYSDEKKRLPLISARSGIVSLFLIPP